MIGIRAFNYNKVLATLVNFSPYVEFSQIASHLGHTYKFKVIDILGNNRATRWIQFGSWPAQRIVDVTAPNYSDRGLYSADRECVRIQMRERIIKVINRETGAN